MDLDQTNQLFSLVFVLLWVVVVRTVVAWAVRPVTREDVEEWGDRHSVTLGAPDAEAVRRYLARSRAWRRISLAVPVTLTLVLICVSPAVQGIFRPQSQGVVWAPVPVVWLLSPLAWVLAYTVGAFAAEATWPRRQPDERRAAAVSARRVGDYLPTWTRLAIRSAPLVAVPAVAVVALVPQRYADPYPRDVTAAAVAAALVLLVTGLVEVAIRVVVARPQPAPTAHAVAVDDALRATAVQALAGASLATLGVLLQQVLAQVAYAVEIGKINDDISWIYVTNGLGIVRFVLVVGGLMAWRYLTGSQRWRVRRPLQPAALVP